MSPTNDSPRTRAAEILLVEDNPADVRLTQEAMRDGRLVNALHVVGDGDAALAFLRREPPYENATRPDLVLLDLNLPGIDGREVLVEIKEDPELRTIPVVVLTTSDDEADVLSAYLNHANAYITKPVDLDRFVEVARQLERFWFSLVVLPTDV